MVNSNSPTPQVVLHPDDPNLAVQIQNLNFHFGAGELQKQVLTTFPWICPGARL
jgi:hypothetical protein